MQIRTNSWGRWLTIYAALLISLFLVGCQSIVIKEDATAVVDAAKKFRIALDASSNDLAKAIDNKRRTEFLAQPGQCKGNRRDGDLSLPLYFTPKAVIAKQLITLNKTISTEQLSPDCDSIINCTGPDCSKAVCLTAGEQVCVNSVMRKWSIWAQDPSRKNDPAAKIQKASETYTVLTTTLAASQFPGVKLPKLVATADVVQALFEYIEVLAEHADKNTVDFKDKVTKFKARLENISGDLKALELLSLATDFQSGATSTGKFLAPLANLLGNIRTMVKDAEDERAIRQLVNTSAADFSASLLAAKEFASIDEDLVRLLTITEYRKNAKESWQEIFDEKKTLVARGAVFDSLVLKQQAASGKSTKAVEVALASLQITHDSLVQLIQNPSDDQKRRLAKQQLVSLKQLLTDIAALPL